MDSANKKDSTYLVPWIVPSEDFIGNCLGWIASAPEPAIVNGMYSTLGDVGEILIKIIDDCICDVVINKHKYVTVEGAFTLRRKLTMEIMLYIIITMGEGGIQEELGEFFEYSPETPTKGAYVRALDRLKPDTLEQLFHEINRRIEASGLGSKTYLKFRIFAVDSSSINVCPNPEEKDTLVKGQGNQTNAHALFDITNGYFLDVIVKSKNVLPERDASEIMISRHPSLSKNALITEDRGYISLNHIAFFLVNKIAFCIRSKDMLANKSWLKSYEPHFAQYMENGEFDVVMTIRVFKDAKAESAEDGVWSKNPKYKLCKDFRYCNENEYFEMSIRIIRVILPSGTPEILISNVSPALLSKEEAKEVYHLRWNEEGEFLHLKYNCKCLYLHHRNAARYTNEIYGSFIMANLSSVCVANSISVDIIEQQSPNNYIGKRIKKEMENLLSELENNKFIDGTFTELCLAEDCTCISFDDFTDGTHEESSCVSDDAVYREEINSFDDVCVEKNKPDNRRCIVCTNNLDLANTSSAITNTSVEFDYSLVYSTFRSKPFTSESVIISKDADMHCIFDIAGEDHVRVYKINYSVLCNSIYEEMKNMGRRFRRQKPSRGIRDALAYAARFRTRIGRKRPQEQIPPRGISRIKYFIPFEHRG